MTARPPSRAVPAAASAHPRAVLALLLLTLTVLRIGHARADALGPEDEEVRERLRFIEARLDRQATGARTWSWGWASFNAVAAGVQSYRAATTDHAVDRVDLIVSASKAALGIVGRLAAPLATRLGAHELRGLPASTPEERRRKLAAAERLLRRNAREVGQRYLVLPHALNLTLNLVGALVVWGVTDAPGQAWLSAGIGLAVGEVVIWTQPARARRDLREYARRFGGDGGSARAGTGDPLSDLRGGPRLSLVPLAPLAPGPGLVMGAGLRLGF